MRPEGLTLTPHPMEFLHQAKEKGLTLDASIVALDYPDNIPTWVLSFDGLDGVRGLVPASETGLPDKDLMPRFVGQQIRVKVKGVDRNNGLAACSRREAVAEAAAKLLPALAENPEQVTAYLKGKETVAQWFFGQVMRLTRGQANPQVVREVLEQQLTTLKKQ